jgi:hypothetical protein
MTQPPPIPDYAKPGRPAPSGHPLLEVLAGLALGGAISAIAWIGMWKAVDSNPWLAFVVAGAKLVIALLLIVATRRLRFGGVGLLLSIPLGALIFFGACVGHLNLH